MSDDRRLPDHVYDNIETMTRLRLAEERALPGEQRKVEELTSWVGRPQTLYAFTFVTLAWMGYNLWAHSHHAIEFDPAPFFILQGVVGIYAALMTTMILVTQNRQSRDARRNAHLDLQVNILAEQRTAKIVALLEELRRDLPNVRDRIDPVAEALQQPIPAHEVSDALDETLGNQLAEGQATIAERASETAP